MMAFFAGLLSVDAALRVEWHSHLSVTLLRRGGSKTMFFLYMPSLKRDGLSGPVE